MHWLVDSYKTGILSKTKSPDFIGSLPVWNFTSRSPGEQAKSPGILHGLTLQRIFNKTPAQAFTPPADEKKMGTIWIFVYYAVYGSGRGRCRDFLVLKWRGGGLNLQIWDLNRAHETERTVFPILQVFSMCRRKLWHKRKHKGYSTNNSAMNTLWTQNTFTINKTCWQ